MRVALKLFGGMVSTVCNNISMLHNHTLLSHTPFCCRCCCFTGKSILASRQSILGWNHRTSFTVESSSLLSMGPPRYLGCLGGVLCPPLEVGTDTLLSPRAAGSSQLSMDIRQAARTCLELPVDLKSFTFCRLTLIPALQRSPRTSDENNFCNVSEFGLSVLSETYAHYLHVLVEGPLPISRQRWEKEEDEELNLRRAQQVQQKQFYAWSGNNTATEEAIPAAVDLMTRPDCLDDIIALATLLCSLGPEYSRNFWTREETTGSLIPHRTLQELELIQTKDDSLLPSYLSWLAALVNDEASANAVHEILWNLSRSFQCFAFNISAMDPQTFEPLM